MGSDLTFYSKPPILNSIYGTNPISWKLFLRIRPGKMDMNTHGMHGKQKHESVSDYAESRNASRKDKK